MLAFTRLVWPTALFAAELKIVRHAEYAIVTLMPERRPAAGERLTVRVDTGPLEHGYDVVVADETGKVLGAVSPFGILARRKSASARIVLPEAMVANTEIILQIWVNDPKSTAGRRPPTESEFEGMNLILIPMN